MAKNVSEEVTITQAKTAKNSMLSIVIVQIASQFVLKKGLDELWSMFFTLQIVCFLTYFALVLPSNSEIYNDNIQSLVGFKMLKPEPIVQIWMPDFKMLDFNKG